MPKERSGTKPMNTYYYATEYLLLSHWVYCSFGNTLHKWSNVKTLGRKASVYTYQLLIYTDNQIY